MTSSVRSLAMTLVALAFAISCSGPTEQSSAPSASVATSPTIAPTGSAPAGIADPFAPVVQLVDQVEPMVVTIFTDNGLGSGIVYSSDGAIVTNNHVIANGSEFSVGFATGERIDAQLVGGDPDTDVAVLRVDRPGLPAAEWADALPEVGSLAVAIGSPLGFENTITVGVVYGLQRTIPRSAQETTALVDLIQTDAAISPGNSGGALVGASGEIMGMNVAYIPPAAAAVSIGFAIPASTVTTVADALLDGREVRHAYLGVRYGPVTPELAERYSLGVEQGLYVLEVASDSPAEAAGIQPGDVITSVAGEPTRSVEDLISILRRFGPGETVEVSIVRGGEETVLQVVLGER